MSNDNGHVLWYKWVKIRGKGERGGHTKFSFIDVFDTVGKVVFNNI